MKIRSMEYEYALKNIIGKILDEENTFHRSDALFHLSRS